MNKFWYLLIIVIVTMTSCKTKPIPQRFQKVKNGIIPLGANTFIITNECDTLWVGFRDHKMRGGVGTKYNGIYFIGKPNYQKLIFKYNIENGRLVGDAYYYNTPNTLLRLGYLQNGQPYGFCITYTRYSTITEVGCRCSNKKILYSIDFC